MKLPIILLCGCLTSAAAWAQGTVLFFNHATAAQLDAPVTDGVGGPRLDGALMTNALVELYAGPAGTTETKLQPVGPAAGFMSGSWAGYFNVGTNASRAIPGVPATSNAVVQVRAWSGAATYESALTTPGALTGKSIMLTLATGGQTATNAVPMLPAYLVGLQSFAITPVGGTAAVSLSIAFRTNALLTLTGLAGHTYQIQVNTNVASTNWLALASVALTGSSSNLVDPGSTNAAHRFYRAQQTQ
ncbi:MAG: hypothetical protein KGS61_17160 [Verrucomicrobia bacterium]|nr:hypothetical protein [Verrucomicrobiota bacterium]